MTRDEHIYQWKVEGGNYSWRKWCDMHGIPYRNPEWKRDLCIAAGIPAPLADNPGTPTGELPEGIQESDDDSSHT